MTAVGYSGEVGATPLVTVRLLSKSFSVPGGWLRRRNVQALRPVSFELAAGELLQIDGASGAGKTTLLQCLARLTTPDAGTILYRGQDMTHARGAALRAYRRRVRLLFQHPSSALDPRFTATDSVAEPLLIGGTPTKDARRLAAEALSRVGLERDLANRYPRALSGGERQRVALARALVGEPELVLADEPVSALDEAARDEALALILRLQKELGFACILVNHASAIVEARRLRL